MVSFNNVIMRMRERPGMWLGSASISKLHSFLIGYETALRDLQIDSEEVKNFWNFHEYVRKYYNYSSSVRGWCNLILRNSSDEETALFKFFDLFEAFLKESSSQLL